MSVLRKTSSGFFKIALKIAVYAILLIVLYYVGRTAYVYGQEVFSSEGASEEPGTDITLVIEEGTSISELANILEEYGVIKDSKIFRLQAFIYETGEVTPGMYTFNDSQSGEEIIETINAGPNGDGTEDETDETTEETE